MIDLNELYAHEFFSGISGMMPSTTDTAFFLCFKGIDVEKRAHGGKVYTVPSAWSHNATQIFCGKYCQHDDVPTDLCDSSTTNDLPRFLAPIVSLERTAFTYENDIRRVCFRLARWWAYTGFKNGYFGSVFNNSSGDAAWKFLQAACRMLIQQVAAPNSPQWFNVGLHHAYGRKEDNVLFRVNPGTDEVGEVSASEFPSVYACFLLGMEDNLCEPGGIMDGFATEARLFKGGAGCGVNVSSIRAKGEPITGGGKSSGVVSFLEIGNEVAGSIKSGGKSRRAALMRILDADHSDVEEFIDWKAGEEHKVTMLAVGSGILRDLVSRAKEGEDRDTLWLAANDAGVSWREFDRVFRLVEAGGDPELPELDTNWEGEGYQTVSGQNSNNTVRVSDDFMCRALEGEGKSARIWDKINYTSWLCADPGLHFKDTINEWNTCSNDGEILASNPCSEVMFLDNTACHLASINLVKLVELGLPLSLVSAFWVAVLDIAIEGSSLPSPAIARGMHNYRNIGLGFSNLGGLLMREGKSYASGGAQNVAAHIMSTMQAAALTMSSKLADFKGAFPRFAANEEPCRRVLIRHIEADEELRKRVTGTGITCLSPVFGYGWTAARLEFEACGWRNAQVTAIAPTGTIGLIMDCDTTGIEPDFALVKSKQLAGGGWLKIVNQSAEVYLRKLRSPELATTLCEAITTAEGDLTLVEGLSQGDMEVLACANDISPEDHILMCAAVQPFVSGSISKTVNLPHSATPEDVASLHATAWQLGLKCVSIYRDMSKLSQPLSRAVNCPVDAPLERPLEPFMPREPLTPVEPRGLRRRLKGRHTAVVQKAVVGGQSLFLTTGEYDNGDLGEIFLEISRHGSSVRGIYGCFAQVFSLALQYGAPLEEMLKSLEGVGFEPSGIVEGDEHIKMADSVVDYVTRSLRLHYLQDPSRSHIREVTPTALTNLQVQEEFERLTSELGSGPAAPPTKNHDGYTGEVCRQCDGMRVTQSGTCSTCLDCGETTGCG